MHFRENVHSFIQINMMVVVDVNQCQYRSLSSVMLCLMNESNLLSTLIDLSHSHDVTGNVHVILSQV